MSTLIAAISNLLGYYLLDSFFILRIVQSLALLEVIHAALKITPSSISFTALQIMARLIYAWYLLDLGMHYFHNQAPFLVLIMAWSLADAVRALYYLLPNKLTGALRYNFFLVLYPVGQTIEVLICAMIIVKSNHPARWILTFVILSYFILGKNIFMHVYRNRQKWLASQ